jgi:hypothetical protein
MEQKTDIKRPVDWRESWRPAFDRIFASLEIVAKLTSPQ